MNRFSNNKVCLGLGPLFLSFRRGDEVENTLHPRTGVAEGRANIEKTEETLKYPNQGETDRYTNRIQSQSPLSLFQNSKNLPFHPSIPDFKFNDT